MNFVNLTPHAVSVLPTENPMDRYESERLWTIASSGVARLEEINTPSGDIAGFPVTVRKFGAITGLPNETEGVTYIVSMPVAQRAAEMGRTDVVSPDSGATAIREGGQIKAVRGFVRFQTDTKAGGGDCSACGGAGYFPDEYSKRPAIDNQCIYCQGTGSNSPEKV